ncbi:MAG: HNH endonuclease signature motif containing protein [Jatrophihabitantaceae bacterium]
MSVADFATNTGSARTGYGTPIPVALAKTWLEPEARAILVLLSNTNGIEAHSSTQRLFTEQQRLAMIARDRGCSYWGCDLPPAWTQAHHVHDYRHTRTTRVDDGTLVCGGNHRSFQEMGWTNTMIHGRPYWVPPSWIDPSRTPRRNRLHD